MSIATESISPHTYITLKQVEEDARRIAKDNGAKVRRHPFSGIDVKFQSGDKKHYHGWMQLRNELVKCFDLLD